MIAVAVTAALQLPITAQAPDTVDPPPVNEEALARRLFEMVTATAGERAVIVHDPTYYPGITLMRDGRLSTR